MKKDLVRKNIYLQKELGKKLDTFAAKEGLSQSVVIRLALAAYLKAEEK